jgi:DNA ligase-1
MNRFAELLDRLAYEPRRSAKQRLLVDYFRTTPDPDRGFGLAALTDTLDMIHAKPAVIRSLIAERADPQLFEISYDYVGDLSETVALMWPKKVNTTFTQARSLGESISLLAQTKKNEVGDVLAELLDTLDEKGRWALLKLITGGLRIGVSARLAKAALAEFGHIDIAVIEEMWHGLEPPYLTLFAWLEGRAPKPENLNPAPFFPVMLAHAIEEGDLQTLKPEDFVAEWKWDGIRVQATSRSDGHGRTVTRLYSRTGDDISGAFPDIIEALTGLDGTLDGELLIMRDGKTENFNALQQRLNRTSLAPKWLQEFPAALRAYDALFDAERDLRPLPFIERRRLLETMVNRLDTKRVLVSPLLPVAGWDALGRLRANPESHVSVNERDGVEGCMIKRKDSPYLSGRPRGLWFKWKRDPYLVDAVLMYAQRGHGKRSSFYSDFTFGIWKGDDLVPVGKSYFGFTDQELVEIDKFVRHHTINRFGPVREVRHDPDHGLVFEVAFEGIAVSKRHRSGLAMRFPRISRLRWDKPPREADRFETLEILALQGPKMQ